MTNDALASFKIDILKKAFLTACFLIILSLIFKQLYFSLGYLIGFLTGVSHFSNIYSSIRAASLNQIKRVKLYFGIRHIIFYLMLAFILAVSYSKDKLMFAGAVLGFLSIKFILYADIFIKKWTDRS